MTQCTMCEKPLSGGLDTYGPPHFDLCFDCFWWDVEECQRHARDYMLLNRDWWQLVKAKQACYRTVPQDKYYPRPNVRSRDIYAQMGFN